MVIVAGIDVGSTTGKAIILKNGEIVSSSIVWCEPRPEDTARSAIRPFQKHNIMLY
jgi:activator of 2-hydroxyglutaryl-CoA dehydratase